MYLMNLSQEELIKFLELAYKAAYSDRELSEEEMDQLKVYRRICAVSSIGNSGSLRDLAEYFSQKADPVKKIVYFEICRIMLGNDRITEKEQEALSMIRELFGFSSDEYTGLEAAAEEMTGLGKRIRELIFS